MKEAAGEANMTVITIVLIGVVAAVGAVLVPGIMDGVSKKSACTEVSGTLKGSTCVDSDGKTLCTLKKCNSGNNKGQWVCGSSGQYNTLCDVQ